MWEKLGFWSKKQQQKNIHTQLHRGRWEDSLSASKQSGVTCQYPSPLFLKHNKESDQMQIKNEILVAFHTRPKTVWIKGFASLRARGHHLVYLYSFRLYCGQYVRYQVIIMDYQSNKLIVLIKQVKATTLQKKKNSIGLNYMLIKYMLK